MVCSVLTLMLLYTLVAVSNSASINNVPPHNFNNARNATPSNCSLCLGLFGNSSVLDGEFLRTYADLDMSNDSDEHPPALSGTFRGGYLTTQWVEPNSCFDVCTQALLH